jgi:hypothetical protein
MITKKTIEAKFRRAGISFERTHLWIDMQEKLKVEVQNRVHLLSNEFNVICFYKSLEYVLLFTTQRLIVLNNGTVDYHLYDSIFDVKLNKIFNSEQTKKENDEINIILKSGKQIDIIVEIGTWPILYSIIKLISSLSDKAAQ